MPNSMTANVKRLRDVLWRNGALNEDAIQTTQAKMIALWRRTPAKHFKVRQSAAVARREETYLRNLIAITGSGVRWRKVRAIRLTYIEEFGCSDRINRNAAATLLVSSP